MDGAEEWFPLRYERGREGDTHRGEVYASVLADEESGRFSFDGLRHAGNTTVLFPDVIIDRR
jgi:hypothetical protein